MKPEANVNEITTEKVEIGDEKSTIEPLGSVHTKSFPNVLSHLGVSLVVSTYQAGKLVFLRADQESLNTHFRTFHRPMGLAAISNKLWVGTSAEVWEFHSSPEFARALEPSDKHDACYLPRRVHFTGDIQIHEMAVAESTLLIVNTRFSCLCTLDAYHSFVPVWQPPFITDLVPDDRCHLNGLAIKDQKAAYVTALGSSDAARGWRENKRNGGIVMNLPDGEIVAQGLSMPHSPRWHEGNLWLLESGTGSLGIVDLARGKFKSLVQMPGFTRGLDFCGRYAFVGLSQVRDTAIFSGLPITDSNVDRSSGVWVIDIDSLQTVAYLQFDGSVREIFAVQVLNGIKSPELINENNQLLADAFVLPPK